MKVGPLESIPKPAEHFKEKRTFAFYYLKHKVLFSRVGRKNYISCVCSGIICSLCVYNFTMHKKPSYHYKRS